MCVERRQIQRFLRALLRQGRGEVQADGAVAVATNDTGGMIRLPAALARKLQSQGLVICDGQTIVPQAAARAWLKREMAGGDGFSAQHRTLVASPDGVQVNVGSDVLLRLGRPDRNGEPFLEPHQLAAGERVAKWADRAHLRARVTMSYAADRTAGRSGTRGSTADLGDMAMDARKQLAEMHRTLPRECAEVVLDVCVYEKGLQEIEAERGWPRRSAKLVLRIGLDLLAGYFGLAPVATGEHSRRPHRWHEAGARPTVFE